jgi:phosphatidylglycerophosphate synthase
VALHLCRPLSGRVTRLLVDLPVHPIHASVAVFIVGLAGCVAIAAGGRYFLPLLGAVLLAGAAVLAGVDGELARLRYQGSFLGGWLDTAGHDITTVATIMAVTANLGNRGGSVVWTWLGVVGAVCAVVAAALAYAHMLATGTATPDDFALGVERVGAANSPGRKLWGVVARSTAREAQALAVLLGAVIGLLQVATIALFVGSALSCSVAVRRRLQQGRETRKT